MEHEVIDNEEIFSQINQFLLKLVPLGNRVSLFPNNDLLNKKMWVILKSIDLGLDEELRIFKANNESINNKENLELTVEDWFYKFIFIRTDLNIRPIDSRENTKLLLPQSLREIIQVAEIFSEMKPLKRDKGYTKFFQELIENLSGFKQYIDYKITSQFNANLSMLNFFREWDSAKPYSKNHLTYSYIYNLSKNSEQLSGKSGEYPFNLWNREEYNLTIGDVLAIIEEWKRLPNKLYQHLDYHFFYLIKINYSIYLSSKLFQAFAKRREIRNIIEKFEEKRKLYLETVKGDTEYNYEQEYEESLSALTSQLPELIDYLQVVNSNFMPQEFSFLDYVKGYTLEDYVLFFPTISSFKVNKDNKDDKDFYYKFIQMFINSELPVLGDISQNIKNGVSQFIFRKFYTYTPFFRPKNRNYQINFFIWPTKLEYLVEILLGLDNLYNTDESDKLPSKYIYKNVFHTDIFIRRNYASRYSRNLKYNFTKALRSINDILSGTDQFLDVASLKTIIYNEDEGSFYDKLYEDEKLGDIFNELLDKKILRMQDIHKYLKESLKKPPSLPSNYKKLSSNLNDMVKDAQMTPNENAKYSKITKKIEDGHVTYQDLMELEEIYNKYII